MAQLQNPQTLASDDTFLLNVGGSNSGPDGLVFTFTITGTNSLVLYKNTAPPGSAVNLVTIPYLNAALALQSAGTAITATGLAYVTPENAGFDLYGTLNWTSGAVVVRADTASLGAGGGSGGTIPAADVTAGTFGANTGETGAYAVPGAFSAGTTIAGTGLTGTSLTVNGAAASPANTVTTTGAINTTLAYDASNKLDISVSSAGAVTYNATGAGAAHNFSDAVAVTGALSNVAATASLAQSTTTAQVNVGTGTGSGNSIAVVRGAAGTERALVLTTATGQRWRQQANSTAEAGANAGSNYELQSYDDSAVFIDTPLTIIRAAGGAIYTAAGRSVTFGGAPAAAATVTRNRKATTGIADATGTAVAQITIPNAAHSATILFTVVGSLGAGGAIGANEASAANSYYVTLARTAGVNVVGEISSAFGAAASAVAGAATVTCTLALEAVSGGVGATNTINVLATITKSGGSSANHTALVRWEVINANAVGITVA